LLGLGGLGGQRGVGQGQGGWRLVGEVYGLLHGFYSVCGELCYMGYCDFGIYFVCFGNYFLLCCCMNQYFLVLILCLLVGFVLKIIRKLK